MALKQLGIAASLATDIPSMKDLVIPRNRILNPAMVIDQLNNGAATAYGASASGWPIDGHVFSMGAHGAVSCQRVSAATPGGSIYRLRTTVTTGVNNLAAGDYAVFRTAIEGLELIDCIFGYSTAKAVNFRFGFKGPAGTYSVAILNGAFNRSYVTNFTISSGQANTDTLQTFTIPGDVTGTWALDNTVGMYLYITLAAGTTYQGTPNAWSSSAIFGTSSNSNGLVSASNVFDIFDVGLHTSYAPAFALPGYYDELQRCFRRYQIINNIILSGYASAGGGVYLDFPIVPMRATPTVTFSGTISYSNMSAFATNTLSTNHLRFQGVCTALGAGYAAVPVTYADARI